MNAHLLTAEIAALVPDMAKDSRVNNETLIFNLLSRHAADKGVRAPATGQDTETVAGKSKFGACCKCGSPAMAFFLDDEFCADCLNAINLKG